MLLHVYLRYNVNNVHKSYYVIFLLLLLQEMQNQMKALNDKSNLPDFSEMLAGFFGGGSSAKKSKAKALKRR